MENTKCVDLAQKQHWDSRYEKCNAHRDNIHEEYDWIPSSYEERLLEQLISLGIEKYNPKSIMEIGCGNSNWLPYIEKKYHLKIYGIDYSEIGCEMVINKLKNENNKKNIFCIDFFDEETVGKIPKVDLIFSLGVVEHFSNTKDVLRIYLSMLSDGGILLTEIPNMTRINGWLTKIYQPEVYKIHKILTIADLKRYYQELEIKYLCSGHLGTFSLGLIAWGISPRFPKLDKYIIKLVGFMDAIIIRCRKQGKTSEYGPFIYIIGKKVLVNR